MTTDFKVTLNDYLTPNQLRDREISSSAHILLGSDPKQATDYLNNLRRRAREEDERRSQDSEHYVKCPRCWGYHSQVNHYEGICHTCRLILLDHFADHPFTRDMEKHEGFIRHESVV